MRSVAEELAASDCNVQDKLTQIQAIMESHTYQSGNEFEEGNGEEIQPATQRQQSAEEESSFIDSPKSKEIKMLNSCIHKF